MVRLHEDDGMRKVWMGVLVAALTLTACGRQDNAPAAQAVPPVASGPSRVLADDDQRLWQGVLPCRDCLGIDTRLLLATHDGTRRFTLQEIYLGAGDGRPFERAGIWVEGSRLLGNTDTPVVVLDPDGAAIAIRQLDDGTLELLGADGRIAGDASSLRLHRQAF
jgi:copper homeostasis protein (lipoprotein)